MVDLPISEFRKSILHSIKNHQVTCISGDTGCGKSTMVPQFIVLDAVERSKRVRVIVTQPRRVAAVSLANRISRQLGEDLGSQVGYKIGHEDSSNNKRNIITVATAGYLLKHLGTRPQSVDKYTHIVLDEVHERDMDMDLLNLLVKKILERYSSKIKLILMSATLQANAIVKYFSLHDVIPYSIHVGKSPFQIDTIYLDNLSAILPNFKQLPSIMKSTIDSFNGAAQSQRLAAAKAQALMNLRVAKCC